jgi:hypothetical protein
MTQRYAHLAPQTLLDAAELGDPAQGRLPSPIGFQEPEFSPPTPYLRGLIITDRASGAAAAKHTPQSQVVAGAPRRRNHLRHTDCARLKHRPAPLVSRTLTSVIKLDQSTRPHAEYSVRRDLRGLRKLLAQSHQMSEASNLSQGHDLRIGQAQSRCSAQL